jgi:hypothetical protein
MPGRGQQNSTIGTTITTTRLSHQKWLAMSGAISVKTPCAAMTSIRRGWKTLDKPGYGTWSHSTRWPNESMATDSWPHNPQKVLICNFCAHVGCYKSPSPVQKIVSYPSTFIPSGFTMRNFCHSSFASLCTERRHVSPRSAGGVVHVLSGQALE